jgi:hypothetical protein
MTKTRILFFLFGAMLMAAAMLMAQHHPNLMAAQQACNQAFEKISAAQQANEWDMHGHAAKAKELLQQAKTEIHEAAMAANK